MEGMKKPLVLCDLLEEHRSTEPTITGPRYHSFQKSEILSLCHAHEKKNKIFLHHTKQCTLKKDQNHHHLLVAYFSALPLHACHKPSSSHHQLGPTA